MDSLCAIFTEIYFLQNKNALYIGQKENENVLMVNDPDTFRIIAFTLLNDYSAHGKLASRDRAFNSFPIGVLLKGCNEGENFETDILNSLSQFNTTIIEDPEETKAARVMHICTLKMGSRIIETKMHVTSKVLFFSKNQLLFYEKFCLLEEARIEFLGEALLQIVLRPNRKNDNVYIYSNKRNAIDKKAYANIRIHAPNIKVYNAIQQTLRKQA